MSLTNTVNEQDSMKKKNEPKYFHFWLCFVWAQNLSVGKVISSIYKPNWLHQFKCLRFRLWFMSNIIFNWHIALYVCKIVRSIPLAWNQWNFSTWIDCEMILLWWRALESERDATMKWQDSNLPTVSQSRAIEIALNYATHVQPYNSAVHTMQWL